MNCPSCGAPLPAGRAKCAYCDRVADVDAIGQSVQSRQRPEHPRICPSCDKAMECLNISDRVSAGGLRQAALDRGGSEGPPRGPFPSETEVPFYIDRCATCLGLFFDTGELEAVIEHQVPPVYEVDRMTLSRLSEQNGEPVRYRRCPVCRNVMNRVNYGGSSGVIADRCREHGVYLDAGELRRILAWVRAGGRLAAAQKVAEENARASRQIQLPAVSELGIQDDGDLSFPRVGALLLKWFRNWSVD